MTGLTAVAGLVTVIAFAAVTSFAATTCLTAVAALAVAAFVATAFATVTSFATVDAAFTTVAAFTAFVAATFAAFAAFAPRAAFTGFFAGAFVGKAMAFAMNTRRFVLAEAGTARSTASSTRQRDGAAGADHEKSNGQHRRETLPDEGSPGCRGGRSARRAHRPQLHSVECERVERGTSIAQRVGDVPQVIGERFVFV